MDVSQIEILLGKVEHAVKVIQQLKEKESKDKTSIDKLSIENSQLLEENQQLKDQLENLTSEINETDELHARLEGRIKDILQYLPDEEGLDIDKEALDDQDVESRSQDDLASDKKVLDKNDSVESPVSENGEQDIVDIENDEERIKEFVTNPDNFENKNLFSENEDNQESGGLTGSTDIDNSVNTDTTDSDDTESAPELSTDKNEPETISKDESVDKSTEDPVLGIIDDQADGFPLSLDEKPESGDEQDQEVDNSSNNEVSVEFAGTLIDDELKSELEFSFEDGNDIASDLPKGVL